MSSKFRKTKPKPPPDPDAWLENFDQTLFGYWRQLGEGWEKTAELAARIDGYKEKADKALQKAHNALEHANELLEVQLLKMENKKIEFIEAQKGEGDDER